MRNLRTRAGCLGVVAGAALVLASSAFAHARVSPPVSLAKELQLYSLAVPTEKENLTTTKIVLTVPQGFGIDSFVAAPGWTRQLQQTGSGRERGHPEGDLDGRAHARRGRTRCSSSSPSRPRAGTYTFQVQQTYSDGSIVNWSGPESSDAPAPTIEAKSSLGGGGTSTLTIVALVARRARRRARSRSALCSPAAGRGSSHEPPGAGRAGCWRVARVALVVRRRPRRRTRTWSRRCRRRAAS